MSDELARELAAILRVPADRKAELRERVAEVRLLYLARAGPAVHVRPAEAERRLARLLRALELGRAPGGRPLADPGALLLLRWASMETLEPADRGPGALLRGEKLIEAGDYARALPIVEAAVAKARGLKAERQGVRHVPVGFPKGKGWQENLAMLQLAEVFEAFTGERPTRGASRGKGEPKSEGEPRRKTKAAEPKAAEPSRFEWFAEKAIGDLIGAKGPALTKRLERAWPAEAARWAKAAARLPKPG